ncbi:MAG: ATPase domain-containing protein, partial [Candidatus Helarchaeota archaeon]
MKSIIEKFGLPDLDELLGGGVSPGSSILMVSEGVGTRKREFSHHFIDECLKKENGHVIIVDYSIPPHNLIKSIMATQILKDIDISRFSIINCYGAIRGKAEYNGYQIHDLENTNDVSKLRFIIDNIRKAIGEPTKVRWVFDDITSMTITIGQEEKVLRFLREIFHVLKDYGEEGDLGLFFIDRKSHSQKFVSGLENLCETVIHLNVKNISNELLPHLRVIKNRFFGEDVINSEVPYSFYRGEVKMRTELMRNFNLLKRNLISQPDGTLELFETKYMLTPQRVFIQIFKNLYESLDYNDYRRITYKLGRTSAEDYYKKHTDYFNVKKEDIPFLIAKQYTSLGYGNIILKKMDIENGLVVIHSKHLFKWEGVVRPIHSVICGGIAFIAEMFSGESYEVIETRCTATGDEF